MDLKTIAARMDLVVAHPLPGCTTYTGFGWSPREDA